MLSSITTFSILIIVTNITLDISAQMWQYTDLHCMPLNLPGNLTKEILWNSPLCLDSVTGRMVPVVLADMNTLLHTK